jgi:hypothetical protein
MKLSIAFFSSAYAFRNEALISMILKLAFPDCNTDLLKKTPIFSRHHMGDRGGKNLQLVVDFYQNNFNTNVRIENVVLIDDCLSESIDGQNLLEIPALFCRRNRIFFVAGDLDDLLVSEYDPSSFLKTHSQSIFSPWNFALIESFWNKGLNTLRRINPELRLIERGKS